MVRVYLLLDFEGNILLVKRIIVVYISNNRGVQFD